MRWVRLEPSPQKQKGSFCIARRWWQFQPPALPHERSKDSTASVGFIFESLRFQFFVSKTKQELAFDPRGRSSGWVSAGSELKVEGRLSLLVVSQGRCSWVPEMGDSFQC